MTAKQFFVSWLAMALVALAVLSMGAPVWVAIALQLSVFALAAWHVLRGLRL